MDDLITLSCNLSDALDRNDAEHACHLLRDMHVSLLADPAGGSDAFYDSWPTLEQAAGASPEAQHLVQQLVVCAAGGCNPREMFSLFSESLSLSLSQDPEEEPGGLDMQLQLLRTLPHLLLRMRRKWLGFLTDSLGMLLRWCAHALHALPWGQGSCQRPLPSMLDSSDGTSASGIGTGQPAVAAGDGGRGPRPLAGPLPLQAAVSAVCEGLASLAAFVQAQQVQQGSAPDATAAAAAGTASPPVLSAQDCIAANQLLLQSGLQLAALVAQLPQSQAAGHAAVAAALAAASPAGMGRRLEALAPAAAAALQLPSEILSSLLALLPVPASTQQLFEAVEGFQAAQRQQEQQRLQRQREQQREGLGGGESGSTCEDEDDESEEGWPLDGGEMLLGAALGLCAAALGPAPDHGSGNRKTLLALPLTQAGAQPASALLKQLESAVRTLLDAGAALRSISLTLLPLVSLAPACRALKARLESGDPGDSLGSASAAQQEGRAQHGGQPAQQMQQGQSTGQQAQQAQQGWSEGQHEVEELLSMLLRAMSLHPLELVRSCAHEALQALLDALPLQARLQVVLYMLQEESGVAVVVALQRTRQEIASAWDAPAEQGPSPFLSREVFDLATESFKQGEPSRRWLTEEDVMANADAMAAALALYRFVLLRQQGEHGQGQRAQHALELSAKSVAGTLAQHIMPLRALVIKLLQERGGTPGDIILDSRGEVGDDGEGRGVAAGQQGSERLESWLALQRLLDVIERVVELGRQKY